MSYQSPFNAPYAYHQAPEEPHKGKAIASLVLGICGACVGLIPLMAVPALICGLIGVVFGGIAHHRTMGKWGLALSLVAILLAIIGLVIVAHAVSDFNDCLNDTSTC